MLSFSSPHRAHQPTIDTCATGLPAVVLLAGWAGTFTKGPSMINAKTSAQRIYDALVDSHLEPRDRDDLVDEVTALAVIEMELIHAINGDHQDETLLEAVLPGYTAKETT